MTQPTESPQVGSVRALGLGTAAFTACFAVWTIFSIIGIQIQHDLGLNGTQLGLLVGTPILVGSLIRVVFGIWTEQYGGRTMFLIQMVLSAAATWLLSYAETYPQFLLAAAGVGLAGGSFAVGTSYVAKFFPQKHQGTALGVFGAGNVGSSITKFVAPYVLVAMGWQAVAQIWSVALLIIAIVFWVSTSDEPDLIARRLSGTKPRRAMAELEPLKNIQVWRFALYYFFSFGSFVALALWLPQYLMGVYGVDIKAAGLIAAFFSVPGSLLRIYGGYLSDRYGARAIMYTSFLISVICLFILSYPPTTYTVEGMRGAMTFRLEVGAGAFVGLIFTLGFAMALGKAAVFKHIPVYYPEHIGVVGGFVGMIGGLGGFVLPLLFGVLSDMTGIWTSCFALMLVLVSTALIWMHIAIRRMELHAAEPALRALPALPEMLSIHLPKHEGSLSPQVLEKWEPENPAFWAERGRSIAYKNLWISVPNLLLAFAVWMMWSMVVAKLKLVGFTFTTDQLFWLTALPAVSGATLRIFYSFMVPVFGGRLWTTVSTLSLLAPAMGVGIAVQNPDTPYIVFVLLALLCGLGGGNFASSMSNISFFFPGKEKGNALAINAGIGNLGVSVMQFLVPLVIVTGSFAWITGSPQTVVAMGVTGATGQLWMQNAGYMWVPLILVAAAAAWFGMNDIASARASFEAQAVIFRRRHNWIMCWLYLGTFGSFIGYSAAFPLFMGTMFPDRNALQFAFLGPLIGAASRALTGWVSDKYGGERVTLWVFIAMSLGVIGVLYAIGIKDQPDGFWAFFGAFMWLFFWSGVGNASTFQMIPNIIRTDMVRLMPAADASARSRQSEMEAAAIVGFTSAFGAFGGFFIPKAFGAAINLTGSPQAALIAFLLFYASCVVVTWWFYGRRGSLLRPIGGASVPAGAAA